MDIVERKYISLCNEERSDINEHLPVLCEYAKDCESIIELGVRGQISTYAFVRELMSNNLDKKNY
jgi:hypothetical protein